MVNNVGVRRVTHVGYVAPFARLRHACAGNGFFFVMRSSWIVRACYIASAKPKNHESWSPGAAQNQPAEIAKSLDMGEPGTTG